MSGIYPDSLNAESKGVQNEGNKEGNMTRKQLHRWLCGYKGPTEDADSLKLTEARNAICLSS